MFSQVYVVFEDELSTDIPIPMDYIKSDPLINPKSQHYSMDPFTSLKPDNWLKPRFDPISPILPKLPTYPKYKEKSPKILCICKDRETAEQFINSSMCSGRRYISGPHNVL